MSPTKRKAEQTVRYTLKGAGGEVYEPHFSFQGFRYVAVEGYPGEPDLDSLTGVVIHSDITPTGHFFESSKPLINQLQHNIVWGQKGNFVDVPTDCPQRDERLDGPGMLRCLPRLPASTWMSPAFSRSGSKTWLPISGKMGASPGSFQMFSGQIVLVQPPGPMLG